MAAPQLPQTPPRGAGTLDACLADVWAVMALDPVRAHRFGCRPDGLAVSRCGTAASRTPLLVGRRAERLCPACLVERIQELFV